MDAEVAPYLRERVSAGIDATHIRQSALALGSTRSAVASTAARPRSRRHSSRASGTTGDRTRPISRSTPRVARSPATTGPRHHLSGNPCSDRSRREISPGFESNDLGYLARSDVRSLAAAFGATHDASAGLLRSARATAYTIDAWNFGGDPFYYELGITSSAELHSFWSVSARAGYLPSTIDDRLTRGGPLVDAPSRWTAAASVQSDLRRKTIANLGATVAHGGVAGNEWTLTPSVIFRPITKLQLQLAPTLDVLHDGAQYVTTVADSSNHATGESDYVFAELRQKTLSVNVRADWSLTNTLSVQLFVQPFVSTARLQRLQGAAHAAHVRLRCIRA